MEVNFYFDFYYNTLCFTILIFKIKIITEFDFVELLKRLLAPQCHITYLVNVKAAKMKIKTQVELINNKQNHIKGEVI